MEDIDFASDTFDDIVAKDSRYDSRAYALLMDVVGAVKGGGDLLEEFKERALDQYGPLAYTVLSEWGLSRTEDIGEMMFNLVDSRRIGRDDNDSADSFAGGYDFRETFLGPYQT